jgi:hypothetical protein
MRALPVIGSLVCGRSSSATRNKRRGDETPQFGLIAEEAAEVFPELVVYDKEGRPETVNLGELEREHQHISRQEGELSDAKHLIQEQNRISQHQEMELADAKKLIEDQNGLNQRQQDELAKRRRLIEERLRRVSQAESSSPP